MSASSTTAPEYWGARAAEYDDLIRRVVPRYDELTGRLIETLPPSPGQVLELGCGTGNLSLRLVTAAPDAHFTFVDASPEMLEITRARLHAEAPAAAQRARFLHATFEQLPSESDRYDLVIASLSLHHVSDPAPVYATIRASLKSGGALRMADGLRAVAAAQHSRHLALWQEFWSLNLTPAEIESVRDHVDRHDHYFTVAEHFAMQQAAGFTECDCIWRDGIFAILTAQAS
jgi:tRNA (cmo5U34)-methyltransferase